MAKKEESLQQSHSIDEAKIMDELKKHREEEIVGGMEGKRKA